MAERIFSLNSYLDGASGLPGLISPLQFDAPIENEQRTDGDRSNRDVLIQGCAPHRCELTGLSPSTKLRQNTDGCSDAMGLGGVIDITETNFRSTSQAK